MPAAIARPDLPTHGFGTNLGARSRADIPLAVVRNRAVTQAENLSGLAAINRELIARAETIESPQRVVLDMDSTEIPATGSRNRAPTTILRIDLLSPAVAVQRRGRLSYGETAAG